MTTIASLDGFALVIHDLLKSDRDVVIGVGGFTGEGKSTFLTILQKTYARVSNTPWSFSNMTWDRKELLAWIDGKGNTREDQKPEYTAIAADELISMFYRRNWYEDDQKGAIELFNKCRDRHLFIGGNIPNFWELDNGFTNRIRFYVYIPRRGTAWIFEQENNPFTSDPWNAMDNRKVYRKHKNPYKCKNFICEIEFPDWSPDEKEQYYEIRNKKRLNTENQNQRQKVEKYKHLKRQRDEGLRWVAEEHPELTQKKIGEIFGGMSRPLVTAIIAGDR